ncbi:transglycosylase domain-containing protein [Streptomyces antarcticus]|uniref:transglycosylase domain-containing protein n=1 Tax=Streptomyces antarcticus TaxID=2996458 RepID=UPI002270AF5B|nr:MULTISPECIES: transglycosylase domain-containing protein [unclassified Streptomyces]MCY0944554.1 transglycosylase domain-containing protein [Streptomyces sp. H34-AA3]MCZ4087454.1 transglycosylase domain-containing protein [Streptomyces sp. H34-S5]
MSDPSPPPGWTPRDPDTPPGEPQARRPQEPPGHQPRQAGTPTGPGAPGKPGKPRKPGKKARRSRTGRRRLLPTWRLLAGGVLLVVLLLGGALVAGYLLVDIPPANAAATAQSNVYLYSDGSLIARDGEVNRVNVPLSQIPRTVREAVLAAEDRDFYSERAVDPKAMLRAAWNTATGKGTQSGSTITQQYVKNYYLGQEQTIKRKAKEFFIAIKLGREKSKDYILEGYLNTSYFGRNAYGIQAASQAYYGKDTDRLTTAEGAYLATLLNSPSAFDVVSHPQSRPRAVARWNYVLDGMVKKDWMPAAERAATRFPEPGKVRTAAGLSGQRGYLVEAVKDFIVERKVLDDKTLAEGGYRITTTIDRRRQNAFVEAVDVEMVGKLEPAKRKADRLVRAGGVSIDPATGKVVALYGGIDYTKQYVNNATRHDYQVASTFKPFVFAAAVENGSRTQDGRRITPQTVYNGDNKRRVVGTRIPYAPENEGQVSYGNITVNTATDLSVNTVFAQMVVDVGTDAVKETAVALGIPEDTPNFDSGPAMALGTMQASVLDMTQAYATLADHGRHTPHTFLEEITKGDGTLKLPDRNPAQAVSREAADTTTSMLISVVDNGTGTAALAAGHPAAGKTGTGELDRSAWFAAYTPDLVTVVSMMGQDPDTGTLQSLYGALGEPRIGGGGYPARIWAAYTKTALEGTDPLDFELDLQPGAVQPPPPPLLPPSESDTPPRTPGGRTPTPPQRPSRPTPPTPATGGQDQGGRTNGGQTDNGQTDGGRTDGGTTDGGQGQGGQTQGGQTNGGQTDGGATAGDQGGATAGTQGTDGATTEGPRPPPSAFLE